MLKVVVDKDIPFIRGVLEKHATVVYLQGNAIAKSDLLDADALIVRTRTKCNEKLLSGTRVRFIASATIGFDHIDTEFCGRSGITWTNAAGCNSSSVQQYVAAALFHISNKLEFELATRTIGIVGVGNVGTKVADLCSALGMRVLLNDPPRERREGKGAFVRLDELLRESDIITVHVPLSTEGEDRTFHMIDERLLAMLGPKQVLMNTSRGEVADSSSLKSCLQKKGIAACVLDVWENEPAIDLELLARVDLGTPHIAGYSADGKATGTSMSVRALSRFFGLDLNEWFPANIPLPAETTIELDCATLRRQKIFCKAVCRTYDILADDQALRNAPASFEHQRSAYPLRREFPAYTVKLKNAEKNVEAALRQLGFNTTGSN